jgi:hypothetical protein
MLRLTYQYMGSITQKMAAAAALSCGSTSLEFPLEPSIKLIFHIQAVSRPAEHRPAEL